MNKQCQLSVNLNKIALLRNARGIDLPNLAKVAEQVLAAGANGITLHPREDERHARLSDIELLSELPAIASKQSELNIEGDPRPSLLQAVKKYSVAQFTIVPVEHGEITSTRGWREEDDFSLLGECVQELSGTTRVSVFMDPSVEALEKVAKQNVAAVEFITAGYAKGDQPLRKQKLEELISAAIVAQNMGLRVHLGHDLNLSNLAKIVACIRPDEVSIGHALVCDAVNFGLDETIRRYLECLVTE